MQEKKPKNRYTKAQLVNAKAFYGQRDLLAAVLQDGESYTQTQANKLLNEFLKRKVQ